MRVENMISKDFFKTALGLVGLVTLIGFFLVHFLEKLDFIQKFSDTLGLKTGRGHD